MVMFDPEIRQELSNLKKNYSKHNKDYCSFKIREMTRRQVEWSAEASVNSLGSFLENMNGMNCI